MDEKKGRLMARNRSMAPSSPLSPNSSTMRTACDLLSLPGMQGLIIAAILPLYLRSRDFLRFLQMQANGNIPVRSFHRQGGESPGNSLHTKTTVTSRSESDDGEDSTPPTVSTPSCAVNDSKNSEVSSEDGDDRLRLRRVLESNVRTIDPAMLEVSLSRAECWLGKLLQFLDQMPLCLSVATATPSVISSTSFPLVYVNQAFEHMTLYERHDILGQNCRFLQNGKVEVHQVEKMRAALSDKQPVNLALTNARKDGSTFFNLLAMRPVFNSKGDYSHVIAAQYDLSQQPPEGFSVDLYAVDIILRLLPAVISC